MPHVSARLRTRLLFAAFLLSTPAWAQRPITGTPGACKQAGSPCVSTYHNDNARDGVNGNETVLTPSIVNASKFGLLPGGTVTVDALIYAQPLYLSGVTVNTASCPTAGGPYNLVLVATENNSIYAFTYTLHRGRHFSVHSMLDSGAEWQQPIRERIRDPVHGEPAV